MTSFRQVQANRRNAQLSTGPTSQDGKRRVRKNAVRHGLTAETVIDALEDAKDYAAFEMSVTADYDAQSAVERELVLRLASVLWRLRRTTSIESGLFTIQARQLLHFRESRHAHRKRQDIINNLQRSTLTIEDAEGHNGTDAGPDTDVYEALQATSEKNPSIDLTQSFIRLCNLPTYPLDRLSRYESALWRQASQILFTLQFLNRGRPWGGQRLR